MDVGEDWLLLSPLFFILFILDIIYTAYDRLDKAWCSVVKKSYGNLIFISAMRFLFKLESLLYVNET